MQSCRLRERRAEDEAFLLQLYASTRAEEVQRFPWSAEQKEAFMRFQYQAREQSFRLHYPAAMDQIVLVNDAPAGRFLIWREPDAVGLLDISLLPGHRQQGIGGALIAALLAEGRRVWLHVAMDNERAIRLYRRLGFRLCEQKSGYFRMESMADGEL